MALKPCLGKATLTAVQYLLKMWFASFSVRFVWIYIGLAVSYAVVIFFVVKPLSVLHRFLKAGLIALYLTGVFVRIMGGSGDYIAWQK
jgi:hypothetical protein